MMRREVSFPDGIVIRTSSFDDRSANSTWRTYGLYLDKRWRPTWPARSISWKDFDVPDDWDEAAEAIKDAYSRARDGAHVEVGCAGGVGRTGTVVACMAVLSGVEGRAAVDWARSNHHSHSVETEEQEEWVLWFDDWLASQG